MEALKSEKISPIDSLVHYADLFRVYLLRFSLKPALLRQLYSHTHWRLSAGMIFQTLIFLPLALIKPALLLAIGPLIFGYPHLVASYRYIQVKSIRLFILMTSIAIILHLSRTGFAHFEQLPFGVWQIVVATLTLIISRVISKRVIVIEICTCIFFCIGLVRLAWMEPLIYVGGTLILHNWIAFIYWIMASKEKRRRTTAILSSLLFLLIHILVLTGGLDSWIPIKDGQIFFESGSKITGWYLASWTTDALVWYRFLVIYTFGLSMHYFVWLKAIPESLNKFEHPSCFRLSLKNLRRDLGKKTLIFFILLSISGITLWIFSLPLGASIYFEMAILHGSLELIFLVPRIFSVTVSQSSIQDKKL